jgi:hypothetical protein
MGVDVEDELACACERLLTRCGVFGRWSAERPTPALPSNGGRSAQRWRRWGASSEFERSEGGRHCSGPLQEASAINPQSTRRGIDGRPDDGIDGAVTCRFGVGNKLTI